MNQTVEQGRTVLRRLRDGNHRFVHGHRSVETLPTQSRRDDLLEGQNPSAIVLGCSDSRVPVEMVFDQGLGSLFVIRIAGNIVAPSIIGSVEFAAERFGVPLVVVLGHSRCGAIAATIEAATTGAKTSPNLASIVDRIRPAIEPLMRTDLAREPSRLAHEAVRANILASTNQLRHGSKIIEQLVMSQALMIVGAEYDLESGIVDFFDGADLTSDLSPHP